MVSGAPSQNRAISQTIPRPSPQTRAGFIVWAPFWLAVGIGLWFGLRHEPGAAFYWLCASVSLGGYAAFFLLPRFPGRMPWPIAERLGFAALSLGLIAAGVLIVGLRSSLVAAPVLDFRYYGPITGRVVAIDRSARDRMRITLDKVVLKNTAPHRTPGKVRLSRHEGRALPEPGAYVMLTGHLGPPPGPASPGAFDFRLQAWFEGLGAVGYSRTPIMHVAPSDQGPVMMLHRTRMQLSAAIQARIGGQAGAVAAALMTGDRSGISEHTNEIMRISGLYHIISISGLHMSMLAAFVYATVRIIGSLGLALTVRLIGAVPALAMHKLAAGTALLASAAYLWLSGGGVATERAFIMVAVMLVAILADRRAISLRTVAIAALIVLVATPEALISASFQMSFAATIALVLMVQPWQAVSPRLPKWSHAVLLLALTSVFAGLATTPFAAAHFGRISQYGLLANLLVVPVMGAAVMNMGVIAALLAPIGLEGPPLWIMGMGARWMIRVAKWISGLGGADMLVPLPPPYVIPLLGAGLMLTVLVRCRTLRWHGVRYPAPVMLLGLALLGAALLNWAASERPDILVSDQGDAVGIMTAAGRVISKPSGGAFVVSNWLADDGDGATQRQASERPMWEGGMRLRLASLGTLRIAHATGKYDPGQLQASCKAGAIIIVAGQYPMEKGTDCLIIDDRVLRREGAIAISLKDQPEILSVASMTGQRAWAPARHRPFPPLTGFAESR